MMLGAGGAVGRTGSTADGRGGARPKEMPGADEGAARGMRPETTPESSAYGNAQPPVTTGEPPADSPTADAAGEKHGESEVNLQFSYEKRSNEQVIEQLAAQLNQGQMVLVKVRVPEPGLVGSLDVLRKLNHDEWPADGVRTTLADGQDMLPIRMRPGAANSLGTPIVPLARELQEDLARGDQTLLVVNGSAEEIHQTLVNLAAQPDVAIEPAQEELAQVHGRWLVRSKGATSRTANAPVQPADKKQQGAYRPAESGDRADVEPAAEAAGRPLQSPQKGQVVAAENMTMVYVYFRLLPETAPPAAAPAEKANDR